MAPSNQTLLDRLIVGIANAALCKRLQLDSELTLKRMKKLIRQKRAVKEQHHKPQSEGSKFNLIMLDDISGPEPQQGNAKASPQ